MKPATFITKRTIVCPECSNDTGASIEHLINPQKDTKFGPWYCDECGTSFEGLVDMSGQVFVKPNPNNKAHEAMTLVSLPPQTEPFYFLLKRKVWTRQNEEVDLDLDYYINEHSCPTNWLRDIEVVMFDGDADPHGVIRHVRTIEMKDFNEVVRQVKVEENLIGPDQEDDGDFSNLEHQVMEKAFPEIIKNEE